MPWTAYIDGGSRGNPGPAAAGVEFTDDRQKIVFAGGFFLGRLTNNQAEYRALLTALDLLARANAKSIEIVSDSELLVRQITGQYRVKSPDLRPLFMEAQPRLAAFIHWAIRHVLREENARADRLANQAMDAKRDVIVVDTLGLAPARAVEPDQAPTQAPGSRTVEVRVIRAPDRRACPAGIRRGQSYLFTTVTPNICVEAAQAVIDAVLALQSMDSEGPGEVTPLTPRCGKIGCGAIFEVRPRSGD